ncbi:FecR family protein [Flavobacterium salmonis]|uniref:Iron dicitrate transport regulator FecR n=1 Tax=Flavobacterium salmonis TaxID=2654844 RepID=A0A6V6YSV5_9FLAO|nr:FecR domain-containing protein [Flavobacterium salmonis]CAD0002379.1 iron dicitrate transport regulator FecR [Flavobacterium salmonis]
MKNIFNISKLIIKKKLKILNDEEKSRLKLFKEEYPFVKSVDFQKIVQKISDYSLINKDRAWKAILEKSNKQENKPSVISINRSWYKYAAAASLFFLFSISYLFFFNKETSSKNPVVVNAAIEIGNSKATLTLEDGSKIALEKGTNYTTNNVSSNGEHIIYDSKRNSGSTAIGSNFLTIPRGGQFFIQLADGTKVWLNSESQLKYPVAFIDGEVRKVELVYGEAYFEVSPSTAHKGSKFEVFTKKQTVEVIGTQFNIKAYHEEKNIYTTLLEGKVTVNIAGQKHLLIPKEQSNFDLTDNQVKIYKADVYSSVAWKEGLFSFNNMSLKDIMKVLSRWYNVDVTFENAKLENVKFNGVLRKDQDLKEILTTIKTTKFINAYEIKNRQIIIK